MFGNAKLKRLRYAVHLFLTVICLAGWKII